MCGITGFFRPDGSPSPARPTPEEQAALQRMNDAMTPRGPDEEGFFHGPGVGLAARRLSIIDVRGSHQPQAGPSGRTVCVFNGEIYNFRELRRELIEAGHVLRTEGDTEVLPHGFEEWGMEGLLRRLNGMFALAIFDGRTGELFLARDRVGIKPLYLGRFGEHWVFGSELKALLPHPAVKRRVDPASLARYLVLEYVPTPRSIYHDIEKVRPGHFVRIGPDGRSEQRPFWTLRWRRDREEWDHPSVTLPRRGDDGYAAWIPPLLAALRDAVRVRLVSEVPIGGLLSGGVDSSAVCALMAELVPDLRTFSIGFRESSFDESSHAREVARFIGSRHTERTFEAERLPAVLDEVRGFLDEPFADGSVLPTWFLSRTVKDEGVTVVLSGDGADELFAGYPTYLAQKAARIANAIPGGPELLAKGAELSELLPSSYENISPDYKLRRFLAAARLPPARRQASWLGAFLEGEMREVLHPDVREVLGPDVPWAEVDGHYQGARGADWFERLLQLDLYTYMSDDILVKVDRASMACSLEVRVPFLDHRVVELAARIPPGLKLRGAVGKSILKRAVAPRLPPSIPQRGKKGFGLPVAKWLQGPWRELLLDTLGDGAAGRSGWFDQGVVDRLIDEHLSGRRDRRKPLWTLLMFRWWETGPYGPG